MIEKPPVKNICKKSMQILSSKEYSDVLQKMNDEYYYWDKVKYHVPKNLDKEDFWNAVKLSRSINTTSFSFTSCNFFLKETSFMQKTLHEFDLNFAKMDLSSDVVFETNKQYYLLSSIMEEAIASSQMEGANTTRLVAKEMLKKQIKPKDKSEQMIFNNYNTIRFLSEHKNSNLTPELLLEIHRQITEKTLSRTSDEGAFRKDNNIFVVNSITGEVAHEPPSYKQIPKIVKEICDFANKDKIFVHPIIKAIIIHFMISYLHPFVDGNGRTARSLFYWYMLKKGYALTEYLSISRIIYKSKVQYEKSFLYTEYDDFDLGYFVQYNLKVLLKAVDEFKLYLKKKESESNEIFEYRIHGLNERQMQIVRMCEKKPNAVYTSKDLEIRFSVNIKTIRSDLEGLVDKGLMETVQLNQRLKGYTRSKNFNEVLNKK